ncbi:MAG: RelA/SpoT family protein [Patescibacteria group bacterium]
MEKEFKTLIEKIKNYNPEAGLDKVKKAFIFVSEAHLGQVRLSGEPVLDHLLSVAEILADWKLDTTSIIAGLLHDVIEDGGKTLEEVKKEFGEQVAELVWGVTKIGELKLRGSVEEQFVENLRKMLVVMAHDLRVVLIKLADRYHNMQTLSFLPEEKQKRIAKETLEVYAPLAERLGIGEIKGRLEDLAFPYVYPQDFAWVRNYSVPYYHQAEEYVQGARKAILEELKKEKIKAEVSGRAKHLYSLWRKLLRPEVDKDITKIHDLVALRILVNSVRDCYAALGVVHKIWKPVPFVGISDFIAVPKPNGYRSIHTKVFGPGGKIIEVQIRTYEMHEEAENGIAAHWYYGHLKTAGVSGKRLRDGVFAPDEKLSWVKQLVAWQKEMVDSSEFLDALKFDALRHRIFVFSPNGDVFDLPVESSPIDFAYAVHTELGDKAVGAKVNGKMVSLDSKLKSGDMVEILTSEKKKGPSRDWLSFVVTRVAKKEILKHFRSSKDRPS